MTDNPQLIKQQRNSLVVKYYKPSELLEMFMSHLSQQEMNRQVIYLQGIYLKNPKHDVRCSCRYEILRDENTWLFEIKTENFRVEEEYSYKYPRPSVTADCVVVTKEDSPKVLLIERGADPYKGCWVFLGGFLNIDETTEQCAFCELEEETDMKIQELQLIGAYSKVDRDPRTPRLHTHKPCSDISVSMPS